MSPPRISLLPILFGLALFSSALAEETSPETQSMIGYKVTPKVIYGQGAITKDGNKVSRDLWMDVYEPVEEAQEARPAVIMTFGGAFHRGGHRYSFHVGGAQDTSMGDYCRTMASRGYVCFAIDYRLTPEGPVPSMSGYTEDDIDMATFRYIVPQVNAVRNEMGLKAIDFNDPQGAKLIRDAVLSAAEDLRMAVEHVRKSAKRYNIDPDRIVVGGFSAGGITSWNVAHGMGAPVGGAFLLSGGNIGLDGTKSVTADSPPILLFLAENDLNGALEAMPHLLSLYEKAGVWYTFAWVPGFGHFYPSGATSLSGDGSKMSVEARILKFLSEDNRRKVTRLNVANKALHPTLMGGLLWV